MTEVRVVELSHSKVVSAYGYGKNPEEKANEVLMACIARLGWDRNELSRHRLFGFNNPDPSEGSDQYGYEFWLTVRDGIDLPAGIPEGISLKEMAGGLYASLESAGIPNPEKWGGVVRWITGSRYQYDASRQWLEELILDQASLASLIPPASGEEAESPEAWTFNLMSPIIEAAQKI